MRAAINRHDRQDSTTLQHQPVVLSHRRAEAVQILSQQDCLPAPCLYSADHLFRAIALDPRAHGRQRLLRLVWNDPLQRDDFATITQHLAIFSNGRAHMTYTLKPARSAS